MTRTTRSRTRTGTFDLTAELRVAYPERMPRLLDSVKVASTRDAIRPESINVHPTQGIVFTLETPSRVKMESVTPADRPRGAAQRAPPVRVTVDSGARKKHRRRLLLVPRGASKT